LAQPHSTRKNSWPHSHAQMLSLLATQRAWSSSTCAGGDTHTHTHTYTHTHIHRHTLTHTHKHTNTRTHTQTHTTHTYTSIVVDDDFHKIKRTPDRISDDDDFSNTYVCVYICTHTHVCICERERNNLVVSQKKKREFLKYALSSKH
jgi:hypothetical protein